MRLSPREEDHLVLHAAGALAQKRLARGLRLNYTEAVALLATQVRQLFVSLSVSVVFLDHELVLFTCLSAATGCLHCVGAGAHS